MINLKEFTNEELENLIKNIKEEKIRRDKIIKAELIEDFIKTFRKLNDYGVSIRYENEHNDNMWLENWENFYFG